MTFNKGGYFELDLWFLYNENKGTMMAVLFAKGSLIGYSKFTKL